MLFSLFNHLGHLLFFKFVFENPFITGVPGGFSIVFYIRVQNSGSYLFMPMPTSPLISFFIFSTEEGPTEEGRS